MKLEEMYRSGSADNDDVEPHSRSSVQVAFDISFAHEQGNEEAFAQLQQLPQFHQVLEKEFTALYNRVMQQFVKSSSIAPGYGWTDDYECEVTVANGSPSRVD